MASIKKKAVKSRSGFEAAIMADLDARRIKYEYESIKITYVKRCCPGCGIPIEVCTYTPDFVFDARVPIVVEGKGRFDSEDRKKMLAVKKDNPQAVIRFLFYANGRIGRSTNPGNRGKRSERAVDKRKTYGDWCDRYGFEWAVGTSIPTEWTK